MARTITLRLPDALYGTVRRYAEHDAQSMNGWIEKLLDTEDKRRRCAAHEDFLTRHPEKARFAEAWPTASSMSSRDGDRPDQPL